MITHGFKNLKVWKKAYDLTLRVYDVKKKDYVDIKSIHTEIIKMLLGFRKSLNRKLKEIKSKL